ncbi:hypothetical protein EYZ11_013093 [Aspergillus tanneri]|uniref:Glyoxalase-like domain-containing protein n=1 Tax=Aspergillus tanneri TaxID=1220188 RepID=A0A4S3IYJ5_9EURO|nr:hypothetical protein EYZ11_013093 [Aspergillus tanneri]
MTPVHFDHVLIQLSTPDFESPPSWLTENFTIIEGGTHTGNRTQNKLIILPDNTYIELLNIIRPQDDFHGYPGDFALTTISPFSANDNYRRLTGALAHPPGDGGLGVTYTPPQAGGRTTPRGEEIRWELTNGYSVFLPRCDGSRAAGTDGPNGEEAFLWGVWAGSYRGAGAKGEGPGVYGSVYLGFGGGRPSSVGDWG